MQFPVHIPLFSIVFHLLGFFFFDFEGKTPLNSIFWNIFGNIFLLGFGQIFASVVALIGCPIMCLMMGALAFVRRGLRNAWDSIIFQVDYSSIWKYYKFPFKYSFKLTRLLCHKRKQPFCGLRLLKADKIFKTVFRLSLFFHFYSDNSQKSQNSS